MNPNMFAMQRKTARVLSALADLSSRSCAQEFDLSGDDLNTSLIQFFPVGDYWYADRLGATDRMDLFRPFAEILGGDWRVDDSSPYAMECNNPTFPGLEGIHLCVHAVRVPSGYTPPPAENDVPFL